jgi:hypothetical protein
MQYAKQVTEDEGECCNRVHQFAMRCLLLPKQSMNSVTDL